MSARAPVERGPTEILTLALAWVSDADAWEAGLACGGQIQIVLERID